MRPPPYAHHFNAMPRAGRERIVLTLAGSLLFVALHAQEFFLAKWWFWAAASALADRNTFTPARKEDASDRCHNPRKKNYENTKHFSTHRPQIGLLHAGHDQGSTSLPQDDPGVLCWRVRHHSSSHYVERFRIYLHHD